MVVPAVLPWTYHVQSKRGFHDDARSLLLNRCMALLTYLKAKLRVIPDYDIALVAAQT